MAELTPRPGDCLLVIDVQNDFCDGGALAVPDGSAVIRPINALMARAEHVVLTQDWHPGGHSSFASEHPDRAPYDVVEMPYGPQTLWPDHCIQGSRGARFHPELELDRARTAIRKGFRRTIDSYSAFRENDGRTETGLAAYLRECGTERVICVGLAFDFCVRWSAEDARRAGFDCLVVESACRAIDLDGSAEAARTALAAAGVALA